MTLASVHVSPSSFLQQLSKWLETIWWFHLECTNTHTLTTTLLTNTWKCSFYYGSKDVLWRTWIGKHQETADNMGAVEIPSSEVEYGANSNRDSLCSFPFKCRLPRLETLHEYLPESVTSKSTSIKDAESADAIWSLCPSLYHL